MKLSMPRTGKKELDDALEAIEEASEKVSCEWEKRQQLFGTYTHNIICVLRC